MYFTISKWSPLDLTDMPNTRRIDALEERLCIYEALDMTTRGTKHHPRPELIHRSTADSNPQEDERGIPQTLRALSRLKLDSSSPEFYGGSFSGNILHAVETAILSEQKNGTDSSSNQICDEVPSSQKLFESSKTPDYLHFISGLNESPTTTLPPRLSTDAYIEYYFETTHRLYPILNRESFCSYYEGLWVEWSQDVHRTALLHIVLALVYQTNAAASNSAGETEGRLDEGAVFYALAKNALADVALSGGGLAAVQTMFLAVRSRPSTLPF